MAKCTKNKCIAVYMFVQYVEMKKASVFLLTYSRVYGIIVM